MRERFTIGITSDMPAAVGQLGMDEVGLRLVKAEPRVAWELIPEQVTRTIPTDDALRDQVDPDPAIEEAVQRLRAGLGGVTAVDEWGRPLAGRPGGPASDRAGHHPARRVARAGPAGRLAGGLRRRRAAQPATRRAGPRASIAAACPRRSCRPPPGTP